MIDNSPATVYCCICEQYYCDLDNANFHNSNPDYVSHMRLRLRPAPNQGMRGEDEREKARGRLCVNK